MELDRSSELLKLERTIKCNIYAFYENLNTWRFFFALVFFITFIFSFVYIVDNIYPECLTDTLENSDDFIGQRAYEYVDHLANIGPKPVGSYENECTAVNYLRSEINRIIETAPKDRNDIEFDLQIVSGSFAQTTPSSRKQKCYQNVQNLVAKIRSKNDVTESILLNCHYDTVFTSPGASDDGINCAVMLEVLRVMSRVDYSYKKNIVFLFNGAEEDGISGSHGFITQHKWAKEITSFINLDSCGAGGRQILFQTGPDAYVLPQIYARSVPHPYGTVIGEELFNLGLIPSDSDFRIFRDYGNLTGLDFAHCRNGYIYHTNNDSISFISKNVVQLTGDNVLALTKALVDYDHLKEDIFNLNEPAVFFDIFGKFFVVYPAKTAFLVNLVAILVSIHSGLYMLYFIFQGESRKTILNHVLIDAIFVVIGILAVTLVLYLLATLIKLSDQTMLWYSNQWFAITYYATPVLLVMFTAVKIRQTFVHSHLNRQDETKVFIFVIQMMITSILLVGTLFGIRSSFILMIGLIGVSISHYLMCKTKLRFQSVEYEFFFYAIVNCVPTLYSAYLFLPSLQILIPMLGREGPDSDPETTLWPMIAITTFLIFAYFIPLILLAKSFGTMHYIFIVIYLMHALMIVSGAFLYPFGDTTPEKFAALHVDRKLALPNGDVKESSGYLVMPMDVRGEKTIMELFQDMDFWKLELVDDSCIEEAFCGVPSLYYKSLKKQHLSLWTSAEKPLIPCNKTLSFSVQSDAVNLTNTYVFKLKGSKFMDIMVLPKNNANLIEWSFGAPPKDEFKWLDDPVYFVRLHEGSLSENDWSFWLKFDISKTGKDVVFQLAWSVFYSSNNTDLYTPKFNEFISKFPSCTRVIPMVAEYETYFFK